LPEEAHVTSPCSLSFVAESIIIIIIISTLQHLVTTAMGVLHDLQVRREKINERMKYLQDLVPGCSKVIRALLMFLQTFLYHEESRVMCLMD
jgi:hypothetical protein